MIININDSNIITILSVLSYKPSKRLKALMPPITTTIFPFLVIRSDVSGSSIIRFCSSI